MSVTQPSSAIGALFALFVALWTASVWAQSDTRDDVAAGSARELLGTQISGSVTSTTFAFKESGGEVVGDVNNIDNYSRTGRLFTDLRLRLDVRRLAHSSWDTHLDGRVRLAAGCRLHPDAERPLRAQPCGVQSGSLGGNEYDLRELWARRRGATLDLTIGRQFVPGLANLRLDGLSLASSIDKHWTLFGALGAHPSRISRSLTSDYPFEITANNLIGPPIIPIAVGAGASYRHSSLFGSFGAAIIAPLATDRDTEVMENPRVFVTDTGSYSRGSRLNIYHHIVLDLQGAGGFGFTNFSLGAHYRPTSTLTVDGALNQVDTETLNSIVQSSGQEPNRIDQFLVYNFHDVLRVASESARLGVSLALSRQRFEISTSAQVRRREAFSLIVPYVRVLNVPAARNAEFQLGFLDRRSVGGFRLGLDLSAIVPFADFGPNRSAAQIARITAVRTFAGDRLELDIDAGYSHSADRSEQGICDAQDPNSSLICYGSANVQVLSTNALVFLRLSRDVVAIGNLGAGVQMLRTGEVQQPPNLLLTGFVRVSYRF